MKMFSKQQLEYIKTNYDLDVYERFTSFMNALNNVRYQDDLTKIQNINQYINMNIEYGLDIYIWGVSDYWSTPYETLLKGCGDCEDFAILKYQSLVYTGVDATRLRIMHITMNMYDDNGNNQHMVLGYKNINGQTLILDNKMFQVFDINARTDIKSVTYEFNEARFYVSGLEKDIKSVKMSRWDTLNSMMEREKQYV